MKLPYNNKLPRGYGDALQAIGILAGIAVTVGLAIWKAVELVTGCLA